MSLTFALLLTFVCLALCQNPNINADTIWGNCTSFVIHADSAINFDVSGALTSITVGNIGTSPGTYITPNPNGNTTYRTAGLVQPSQIALCHTDKGLAYNSLSALACTNTIASELGGVTLTTPGVYCSTGGSFTLNGLLTLNGGGQGNFQYVFKMDNTLTTSPGSSIVTLNTLQNRNVYWVAAGAVVIGSGSTFLGQVITTSTITVGNGANFNGRALTYSNFTSAGANTLFSASQTTNQPTSLDTNAPVATNAPTASIATITALIAAAAGTPGTFSGTGYTVTAVTFNPTPTATTEGRLTFAVTCNPNPCDQTAVCNNIIGRIYNSNVLGLTLNPAPCLAKCLRCMFDQNNNAVVTVAPGYNSSSGLFASLALMIFAAFITL